MTENSRRQATLGRMTAAALLSASYVALGVLAGPNRVHAQASAPSQLPPVQVSPPEEQKRRATGTSTAPRANRSTQRSTQTSRRPQTEPAPAPKEFGQSQEARTEPKL